MKKKDGALTIVASSILVMLAVWLACKSGGSVLFVNPFNIPELIKKNAVTYLLAAILFSMGVAMASVTCFSERVRTSNLLLFAILPPISFLIFFGLIVPTLLLMFGWIMFAILLCREINIEREAYKKPRIYTIITGSFKKAFTLFSLLAALSVYFLFTSSPHLSEKIIMESTYHATEISAEMMEGVEEAQKAMLLEIVSSVEGAFLMAASTRMSEECREELREIYPIVDNMTRSAIIKQAESSLPAVGKEEIVTLTITQLKNTPFYEKALKLIPIVVASLAFFLLEMIKSIILAPLVGMFSLLLVRGKRRRHALSGSAGKGTEFAEEAYVEGTYI